VRGHGSDGIFVLFCFFFFFFFFDLFDIAQVKDASVADNIEVLGGST